MTVTPKFYNRHHSVIIVDVLYFNCIHFLQKNNRLIPRFGFDLASSSVCFNSANSDTFFYVDEK